MHGRILRRIFRDVTRTGDKPKEILKYFLETVEPMHEKFIEPTKKNAQLIISNEYNETTESKRAKNKEMRIKFNIAGISSKQVSDVVHSMG
jgi:uridine kinase